MQVKVFDKLTPVWMYHLVRWGLSALFIWAGTMKLVDPHAFSIIIMDFGIVPESFDMPIAFVLPILEITAAFGLIFDMRGSLPVIFGLLALFIGILGYGIWLGLDIDCGCFVPEDPETRVYNGLRLALYRDLAMMVAIFFLYFWRFRQTAYTQAEVMQNKSS